MPLAKIDISSMIPPALRAIPEVVNRIIPEIAEATRAELVRLAGQRLTSTSQEYVAGLQPVRFTVRPHGKLPQGEVVATLELVGWLPNAVENGWPGGDQKEAILRGRNAKTGKDGDRYNTIPFSHGTPGSTGRNAAPMGSAHRPGVNAVTLEQVGAKTIEEAMGIGKRVHARAKKLKGTTTEAGRETQHGDRLPAGLAPKLRTHHKTDIYAGMVRKTKTYKTRTQSTYSTFRRVSDNSDTQAFIHPGIEGHRLFDEAQQYAGRVIGRLMGKAMTGLSRGGGI